MAKIRKSSDPDCMVVDNFQAPVLVVEVPRGSRLG